MYPVPRVKICGITNPEDVSAACNCGADALGFIFVPGSSRYVGNDPDLLSLLRSAPPFVTRVGVCLSPDQIPAEALHCLDALQTYDHSRPAVCKARPEITVIPAFRIRSRESLNDVQAVLQRDNPAAILLDAYHEGAMGGAGAVFDWSLAAEATELFSVPLILAGGLNPENVALAIRQTHPYAVDVSTGVESDATPRRKDLSKMQAFVMAAKVEVPG